MRGCCHFPGESIAGGGVALDGVVRAPLLLVLFSARAVVEDIVGGCSPCAAAVMRGWRCRRSSATRRRECKGGRELDVKFAGGSCCG